MVEGFFLPFDMKFKIDIPVEDNPILDYQTPVLAIGSCFADRMSDRLRQAHFNVLSNPYGTLYNPVSMAQNLLGLNTAASFIQHNGLWNSFQHHSDVSRPDQSALTLKIQEIDEQVLKHFGQTKTTNLVTFGSAQVFTFEDKIVANCHKVPSKQFSRRLLTVEEIVNSWSALLSTYPNHDFLFTVSPVRYTREGMHTSNLSKSILLLAANQLVKQFGNAFYFPAYELVIDELRDYRFYKEDLVHPNKQAVDYVWGKVKLHLMTERTKDMIVDLDNVVHMQQHKLLHPESEAAQKFIAKKRMAESDFEDKHGVNVKTGKEV